MDNQEPKSAATAGGRIPTPEDCAALLESYRTPEHVRRHCRAVAKTALRLGRALIKGGASINLPLLEGAALLHDIARIEPDHGTVGAAFVREQGYAPVAELIRRHMYHETNSGKTVFDEQDLLCLADRMVREDHYVGLERRMQAVIDKYRDQPDVVERISAKLVETRQLIREMEGLIGCTVDDLMQNAADGDQDGTERENKR